MHTSVLSYKRIFLIDAIGAFVTASLLSLVLARLEPIFGMPERVLYFLAAIALVFAIYSFLCSRFVKEKWAIYLRGIAMANTLYCMFTLGLIIYWQESLTWLGKAYFIGEILVVMGLVILELKISKKGSEHIKNAEGF
ncbi:MAG: hypothetical protein ACOCXH_08025 [Cyclobacteriaceae bacterium]